MVVIQLDTVKYITVRFILRLYHLYHNHVFTSSRISKEVLKTLNLPRSYFPKIHKIVRLILSEWADEDVCVFISQTSLCKSKKTKETYQFTDEGVNKLRQELVDGALSSIQLKQHPIFEPEIKRSDITYRLRMRHIHLL